MDLLPKSGVSNSLEFKCMEVSYIWSGGRGLMPVSVSCVSIFSSFKRISIATSLQLNGTIK